MASAKYKGFSANVPDLLLYGAVGFAAYSLYKTFVKPVSNVTEAVSDTITGGSSSLLPNSNNAGQLLENPNLITPLPSAIYQELKNVDPNTLQKFNDYLGKLNPLDVSKNILDQNTSFFQDILRRVTPQVTTTPASTSTSSSSQSSNYRASGSGTTITPTQPIVNTPTFGLPNSYSGLTGIGFDASGRGYSSATNLGSRTFSNPSTGSTVTRGAGSLFANKGFN